MAVLTVQKATVAGGASALTYTAASALDQMPQDSTFHVKNGSGASITVTIASYVNCDQNVNHPISVAVAAGTERRIGPLGPRYVNPASGYVEASYSATASVTVAAEA